jgi:hypothetical protein
MTRRNRFRLTPPKAPKLREDDVEKACLDLLAWRGWYVIRLQVGRFRTLDGLRVMTVGKKGLPDYVAVHERYPAFFMETKAPGEDLSADQIKTTWAITTAYKITVVKIDRVEDLIPWLDAYEGKRKNEGAET